MSMALKSLHLFGFVSFDVSTMETSFNFDCWLIASQSAELYIRVLFTNTNDLIGF